MDSKNQFQFFCLSIVVGLLGGVLYELCSLLRSILGCNRGKNKWLGVALDIFFGVGFSVWCVYTSFLLHFPDFRGYIWVGYAIGGIIYLKTLHIMVAIFKKVCYNRLVKLVNKAKKQEKTLKKEVDISI